RVKHQIGKQYPDIRSFLSSGSMVDAVLNMGMPAPIDVQVSSPELHKIYGVAEDLAGQIRAVPGVGEVYIPQDLNYPALRLDVDRIHAAELGLTQKDVVDNVITALNSNSMIAPNYWVDRRSGNDYYLTVQYFEKGPAAIHDLTDLGQIPLRGHDKAKSQLTCGPASSNSAHVQPISDKRSPVIASWSCGTTQLVTPMDDRSGKDGSQPAITELNNVVNVNFIQTPTEVDHYQIQRVMDVYVTPSGEDLQRVTSRIQNIVNHANIPANVRVNLRGMVEGMNASFKSF